MLLKMKRYVVGLIAGKLLRLNADKSLAQASEASGEAGLHCAGDVRTSTVSDILLKG